MEQGGNFFVAFAVDDIEVEYGAVAVRQFPYHAMDFIARNIFCFHFFFRSVHLFDIQFQKSGFKERSKFLKALIFEREVKVVKLDKAAMDYYIRLTNFYHQFQAIGNNYNQTVRAVKANFGDKRAFALVAKLEKATLELVVLSKHIVALTREFEERHLNRKSGG